MLDADAIQRTLEDTQGRFEKLQEKAYENEGYSGTAEGLGITQAFIQRLSDHIHSDLSSLSSINSNNPRKAFLRSVEGLGSDLLALVVISGLLDSIALNRNHRDTAQVLGGRLAVELWAAKFKAEQPELAARSERFVREATRRVKYRREKQKRIAARRGFVTGVWSLADRIRAGTYLLDWALKGLPDVFLVETLGDNSRLPRIYENAIELGVAAAQVAMQRLPMFSVCLTPPAPWTAVDCGGYWNRKTPLGATFVRNIYSKKEIQAAVRQGFKDGSLKPHIDGINALQDVPWTINTQVLDVLKWCAKHAVSVKGLPSATNIEMPPQAPEDADEKLKRHLRRKRGKIAARNRGLLSQRVSLANDIATAERLAGAPFWTPISCDWRGRAYPLPGFNFTRDDRVRGLFLFNNGLPIGEEGLYWLKVHCANCGEFDGVHKRSFDERVKWVDDNIERIKEVAWQPKGSEEVAWWSKADQPFLFLAACFEIAAALEAGPSWVTRLPVSFDGSCSGLQHLCAMTRAPEGALVNLTPAEVPQDVYQTVADLVTTRVKREAKGFGRECVLARLFLDFGIDRKLVKRNVMTYAYSSKVRGMIGQHMEDLMEPLSTEVLEGAREAHPFSCGFDSGFNDAGEEVEYSDGFSAACYIAKHVYRAIGDTVTGPSQAMEFMQKIAAALAHESKPVRYVTPSGFPVVQCCYDRIEHYIQLHLSDVRVGMKIADGYKRTINKTEAKNGVAPNIVHSLDAAHLVLTVNACVAEGIRSIATVHDSYGCLAPQAGRFNAIIREQFVRMYTMHDPLLELREACLRDLTPHNAHMIPEVPARGTLDLKETLNAQLAFA